MQKELVSIIVPVYNAEKFIGETIESVLNQTYKNFELLLVDDCSKDKSVDVINKYVQKDKRIKLICNKNNSGAALSRNIGIDASKGRFICYLDADDKWNKTKLYKLVNFMLKRKVQFSYTSYEFADENG